MIVLVHRIARLRSNLHCLFYRMIFSSILLFLSAITGKLFWPSTLNFFNLRTQKFTWTQFLSLRIPTPSLILFHLTRIFSYSKSCRTRIPVYTCERLQRMEVYKICTWDFIQGWGWQVLLHWQPRAEACGIKYLLKIFRGTFSVVGLHHETENHTMELSFNSAFCC